MIILKNLKFIQCSTFNLVCKSVADQIISTLEHSSQQIETLALQRVVDFHVYVLAQFMLAICTSQHWICHTSILYIATRRQTNMWQELHPLCSPESPLASVESGIVIANG